MVVRSIDKNYLEEEWSNSIVVRAFVLHVINQG